MRKIACTGIKPTGTPHIGNYFGAIKPALELTEKYDARYFIADYHALNTVKNADLLQNYIYKIAATWLACGLEPEEVLFYRQSDVPETFELTTILSAFTPKGLMNRAHAYKAKVAENNQLNRDPDDGVNMGLYTYPILMAADILLFNTDVVPVGEDQKQHVEMAADIGEYVNKNYEQEVIKIPEPVIRKSAKTVIGIDGRKMSKSYKNVLPLFEKPKKLRKKIMKIVTNSQTLEEPKDPENCNIFAIYKLFADRKQIEDLAQRYRAGGMGWGHAKQELFEVANCYLEPMRAKYKQLIADKDYIDDVLAAGAKKARIIASDTLTNLKQVIGLL